MELTNTPWEVIGPLLPEGRRAPGKKGRPRRDNREVLNGILWIPRTGVPWKAPPERHPPRDTCHTRFQEWVNDGTLEQVLKATACHLKERGGLNQGETFIGGTFGSANIGGGCVGPTKGGTVTKSLAIVERPGFPVAVCLERASPHEVTWWKRRWITGLPRNNASAASPRAEPAPLEGRTLLHLAPNLPSSNRSLGVSWGELPRTAQAGLHHDPPADIFGIASSWPGGPCRSGRCRARPWLQWWMCPARRHRTGCAPGPGRHRHRP